MKTTTELLKAYRADPSGVCMQIERAARRARAEAMSQLPVKAAASIHSGFRRFTAWWYARYARRPSSVARSC
jgi:hypothetical protein